MCVLAPGLSLSIIIDSRVKLIDNERLGASPCDPRGRLHANNTLIVLYNIRLHIPCSYFAFSLGFFHFLFHAEAANRKQTVNIATRGTMGIRIKVITKLPNSEQSYKGKVKTHNYINRQNQSTTGKL